jgi:RimJ/RimL family protein N-acetyltransferase
LRRGDRLAEDAGVPAPDELVLETERLWIRLYRESDADRTYDTLRRWEVSRWLGDDPKVMSDRDEAVRRIVRWRSISEADPRHGVWAVEVKETGALAGCALLVPAPDPDDRFGGVVEVGWHLHPDSWGHGYAREAGGAALRKGLAEGLDAVHAFVRPDNLPSARVCEAIGMRLHRTSVDEWDRGQWLQFRTTAEETT